MIHDPRSDLIAHRTLPSASSHLGARYNVCPGDPEAPRSVRKVNLI